MSEIDELFKVDIMNKNGARLDVSLQNHCLNNLITLTLFTKIDFFTLFYFICNNM